MFDRIKKIISCIYDINYEVKHIEDYVTDIYSKCKNIDGMDERINKLKEADNLVKQINDLVAENIKLKEENSVYIKYYDIGSEATDEIKEKVFREFEIMRLKKQYDTLCTQLQMMDSLRAATACNSLLAYPAPAWRFM